MIRNIQRAALDRSLKAARLVPDTTAKLLGREDAEVALDQAEAGVRDVAGRLLFDDQVRDDARLRKIAARERGEALRLRARAAQVNEESAEELAERERQAEQQRKAAADAAAQRKQRAARTSAAAKQRATKTAQARAESAAATEQRRQEAIDAEAKRERLAALDRKADALDHQAEAATARDEAQRLKRAATAAKAERKSAS